MSWWDNNYWGIIAVPIGVLLGFGPALFMCAFSKLEDVDTSQRGKPRDIELE